MKSAIHVLMLCGALLPHSLSAAAEPAVLRTIDVEPVWAGHSVGFTLLTSPPYQYLAYYDAERRMTVAGRKLDEPRFRIQRLSSRLAWDSHNYVTLAVDRDGHLHVTGNMHAVPLVYFRSERPHDVESLRPVQRMTGDAEGRVTYPRFFHDAAGRLLFTYRDGGSGNGRNMVNAYDEATRSWSRLIDAPLFDGVAQSKNAYPTAIEQGPDGWFHVIWMWRDTPDCETNHHLSYARSRDLVHWESAAGTPVSLPLNPTQEELLVDPVPPFQGLINMGFALGFDAQHRPVLTYHKYGADGASQIFAARREGGAWVIRQLSNWSWRWAFSGGGTISGEVGAGPVRLLDDGRLVVSVRNAREGGGTWLLDPVTLAVKGSVKLLAERPKAIGRLESDFPGMQVRVTGDEGQVPNQDIRYWMKWETLPSNRDRPREGPLPDPGMLRVYEVR